MRCHKLLARLTPGRRTLRSYMMAPLFWGLWSVCLLYVWINRPTVTTTEDDVPDNYQYFRMRGLFGSTLDLCPDTAERLHLRKRLAVNDTVPTWEEIERQNPELETGGRWSPADCVPRHNVAIIVPYRDRLKQLLMFLRHVHPLLQKQKIAYTIYVVEQVRGKVFNRGLIRNIGFVEALALDSSHQCSMFHDVDLLPLSEANLYICPQQPRHVCTGVNYYKNFTPLYRDKYAEFGHVTFFTTEHYKLVNGYSNLYIGWGAEDDDIHSRVKAKGLHVLRYPDIISQYYGVPHPDESVLPRPRTAAQNVSRFKLLNTAWFRMTVDGLSDLRYTRYNVSREKLFTRVLVDVDEDYYSRQAVSADKAYDKFYGDLTIYWKDLVQTPPPYFWRNPVLERRYKSKNNLKAYNRNCQNNE